MSTDDRTAADWRPMDDFGFAALVGGFEQDVSDLSVGRYRFATDDRHANRNGFVHGGLLMTVADHGMGLAARQGDFSLAHATVQFNMLFIAAVRPGALVEMDCRVIRARRTTVFMDGEVRADGEVAATCTGTWRRFVRPA